MAPHRNFERQLVTSLDGCLDWQRQVLAPPAAVTAATARVYAGRSLKISDSGTITNYFAPTDGQGRKMSHKVAANDYAPRVFAAEKNGISLKRF
jgi:hypothetical protein